MKLRPFIHHQGVAAPLLRTNIDTDAIIPSREMRLVSKKGLATGLFANWRYLNLAKRQPDPNFVLNQADYAGASILLGGANFGCGSSREHAVWALKEFGVRAIVAPSFGAIFLKNCIANGLLPAATPEPEVRALADWVKQNPQEHRLLLDLEAITIGSALGQTPFVIREASRIRLIQGLDPIDYTLTKADLIDDFERRRFEVHPWAAMDRVGH